MNETAQKLRDNSFAFALRMIKLSKYLESEKKDRVLSKQILRSGTSIGANLRESRFAQSGPDFVSKLSIALKEAEETAYWLELLYASAMLSKRQFDSLHVEVDWLIGTLVNVVKSNKRRLGRAVSKT